VQSEAAHPQNSAVTNYYQIAESSISNQCLLELFLLMVKEPLFFVLRTQEQLAYTVSAEIVDHHKILGFTITVSSKEDKNPAVYVDEKTSDFIRREVKNILLNLTDERFNTFRDTQISLKKVRRLYTFFSPFSKF
jgi:secreted Zn-dependent insulinase-like peptidase